MTTNIVDLNRRRAEKAGETEYNAWDGTVELYHEVDQIVLRTFDNFRVIYFFRHQPEVDAPEGTTCKLHGDTVARGLAIKKQGQVDWYCKRAQEEMVSFMTEQNQPYVDAMREVALERLINCQEELDLVPVK